MWRKWEYVGKNSFSNLQGRKEPLTSINFERKNSCNTNKCIFYNLYLLMIAFYFCLESENKICLIKHYGAVSPDIIHTVFCIAHTCFSIIISPYSWSWHKNFFRNVKDSVHKLQNIAFVDTTSVFHFIILHRVGNVKIIWSTLLNIHGLSIKYCPVVHLQF